MNKTFDVRLEKKNLVVRFYLEDWKAIKEKYLYNLIAKKTKVPSILYR